MNPIELQRQLKHNSEDLEDFCRDLSNWGEEMKRKETVAKTGFTNANKLQHGDFKRSKTSLSDCDALKKDGYVRKNGATDYSAWDKYDAESAYEKIDYSENEDSDLTDECDDAILKDKALSEKEKGNNYVKKQNWSEAIACYTKAIRIYDLDPIFYANRALCFLKQGEMTKAEADCTMSLKLDKCYVKAYQRRAAARETLNKLKEAEEDLLNVLELQPNNTESKNKLANLRKKLQPIQQRPTSIFSASRNLTKPSFQQGCHGYEHYNGNTITKRQVDTAESLIKTNNSSMILVKAIDKKVQSRSKQALKRINIQQIDKFTEKETQCVESKSAIEHSDILLPPIDLKIDSFNAEKSRDIKNNVNKTIDAAEEKTYPKNSVEFYLKWRQLITTDEKYSYLKDIPPNELSNIFKESLDISVLEDIITTFSEHSINNINEQYKIYPFLLHLSSVKRFSIIVEFLSSNGKKNLWKLFEHVKKCDDKNKDKVDKLLSKYHL